MKVAPPPRPKCTPHEPLASSSTLVSDQYTADWTARNGWPGGRVGPGGAMEGSTRLASSGRDGSRQPFWPPTFFSVQVRRATLHLVLVVCGDFSQTKPDSLSNTASLLKAGRMTNRCAAARALSRFWVTPGRSASTPCASAGDSALSQAATSSPPSTSAPIVTVRNRPLFITPSLDVLMWCRLPEVGPLHRPAGEKYDHVRDLSSRPVPSAPSPWSYPP